MATRNFVPRADGEGHIGKPTKKWLKVWANNLWTTIITDGIIAFTPEDVHNVLIKKLIEQVEKPADKNSPGVKGQIHISDNFGYVCVGDSKWKRFPLSDWEG